MVVLRKYRRIFYTLRQYFNVQVEERLCNNIDFYIENMLAVEKFRWVKKVSDYDIFLNKIYSAGKRVDSEDSLDAAFLDKFIIGIRLKLRRILI